MARAGVLEETDGRKLSVMVAQVENELQSSERNVELGYNMLRFYLGLQAGQKITLTSTMEEIVSQYILNSETGEPFAIGNNIDYQMMSRRLEMAGKMVDLKKSNYLPTVSAFYSRTEKLAKPLFDVTPKNVVGLTVNVPIFSSGVRNAQLKQARIDQKISENNQILLADQLTLEERQLQYSYNKLKEQFRIQKDNIAVAKEILDKMNLKLMQGVVSSIELTTANNDYLNAESTYTGIILQMLKAEVTLRKMNNKL